jgi:hypothetical protein
MSDTVIVALISAGASALVAITALVLNYRGFAAIDARFCGPGKLHKQVFRLGRQPLRFDRATPRCHTGRPEGVLQGPGPLPTLTALQIRALHDRLERGWLGKTSVSRAWKTSRRTGVYPIFRRILCRPRIIW